VYFILRFARQQGNHNIPHRAYAMHARPPLKRIKPGTQAGGIIKKLKASAVPFGAVELTIMNLGVAGREA